MADVDRDSKAGTGSGLVIRSAISGWLPTQVMNASFMIIGVMDAGRVDRIYSNTVWGEDVRIGSHEADHAVLGRDVAVWAAVSVRHAFESGRGADDDDRSAASAVDQAPGG